MFVNYTLYIIKLPYDMHVVCGRSNVYRATLRRVPTDTLNYGWSVSSVPGIDGVLSYAEGIMVIVIVHVDSSPFGGFILCCWFLSSLLGGLGIEWYYRLLVWEYGNG